MFKRENGKEIIVQQQYKNGQHLVKNYVKGNLLGKGGFAKCYEILSQQTNIKYAVKIIQKASLTKAKAKQKLQSQISIHRSLSHTNIVNFQHFFQDSSYVYILLEICRPQTLNDLIKRRKRITQFETKYYIYQITNALKYIHNNRIIHRDLKLGNLFLSENLQIKIGDFGLATKIQYDSQRKKTMCGTPNYIAPQILQNKKGHSYQVDIWSLGVITYALIFGRPPFQTSDLKLTYSKIKSCNYSFPDNVNVSNQAKKFITKILQLQPHKRPTLDQILQDEFLQSIQMPKSLPISTISIPPSANLIKKYQKSSEDSKQQQKSQENASYNSFKVLERNKAMMSTDKLERIQKNDTLKKQQNNSQSSGNHMNRAASTATLLGRKKTNMKQVNLNVAKQNVPIKVIFYQENPKFGASYMLSTNAIGMRYNDSTCIVSNSHQTKLKYIVMESNLKQISAQTFDFVQAPTNLQKKMKIINFYSKELKKKKDEFQNKISYQMRMQLQKMKTKQTHLNALMVYVTRSIKTSKAVFFQFNNGFTQVIFEDSSQLIYSFQEVTYINKFSQIKHFKALQLNYQPEDIKKRMNYAYSVTEKVKKNSQSKQNRFQNQKQTKDRKMTGRSISSSKFGKLLNGQNKNVQETKQLTREGRSYQSTNKLPTTNILKEINFNKFS